MEFECPAASSSGNGDSGGGGSSSSSSSSGGSENGDSGGESTPLAGKEDAGYWRQEVEGLGGVVKKKFRKRERVGGTVREWEEESRGAEILGREKSGEERAWCGWCARVVPGKDDVA